MSQTTYEFTIPDFEIFFKEYNEVVDKGLAEYKTHKELFIWLIQMQIDSEKKFKERWFKPYKIQETQDMENDL